VRVIHLPILVASATACLVLPVHTLSGATRSERARRRLGA
jgi:hypothetical protein